MRNILIESTFVNYKTIIEKTSFSVVILHPVQLLNSWCVNLKIEIDDLTHSKIIHGNDALQTMCLAFVECHKFLQKSTIVVLLKELFPLSPYLTWDSRQYKKIENYFTKLEETNAIIRSHREFNVFATIGEDSLSKYSKTRVIEIDISRYDEISEGVVGKITTPLFLREGHWCSIVSLVSGHAQNVTEIVCKDPISSFVVSYNKLRTLLEEHLDACKIDNFPTVEYFPKFLFYDSIDSLESYFQIAIDQSDFC